MENTNTPKSKFVMIILCIFGGYLGIHRAYAGKSKTGLLMILVEILCLILPFVLIKISGISQFIYLIYTSLIWWIVDLIVIIAGKFKDSTGKTISK